LFFSGARYGGGELLTNQPSRAAEKQKEKGCAGVAFYKQVTTNVVGTGKENLQQPNIAKIQCLWYGVPAPAGQTSVTSIPEDYSESPPRLDTLPAEAGTPYPYCNRTLLPAERCKTERLCFNIVVTSFC
jgi:hypothetical protein